jgi:hypothetical protein
VTLWALIGSAVIAVVAYALLSGFLKTYRRYRGTRVITCPGNSQPASVRVDALKAAHWAAISGDPVLRLSNCSRWPENAGCGQECLTELKESPESCAVKSIVSQWYAGKSCVYCSHEIGPIVWHERPPAVRSEEGIIREWTDIAPETLPQIFRTHEPVCFNCSLTERLLHDHPEMVVNRDYRPAHERTLTPTQTTY